MIEMFKVREIGILNGEYEIFINNHKQFLAYLKEKYDLPRRNKGDIYIDAWQYEVTVSAKVWEMIKDDQYLKGIKAVPLEQTNVYQEGMQNIADACSEICRQPKSSLCSQHCSVAKWCKKPTGDA
jgi:hypothetical protein